MSNPDDIPEDFITQKQDDLTNLLLSIHEVVGEGGVRSFLRLAVINYIEEVPVSGRHKLLQRVRLVNQLAEAITIPCYAHDTIS